MTYLDASIVSEVINGPGLNTGRNEGGCDDDGGDEKSQERNSEHLFGSKFRICMNDRSRHLLPAAPGSTVPDIHLARNLPACLPPPASFPDELCYMKWGLSFRFYRGSRLEISSERAGFV